MTPHKTLHSQRGLSLVELMIAITLGLILVAGVIQVFLSSKTVYTTQQALSRVQETGRIAVEFLNRDVRMAGYMGCASRNTAMEVTNTLNNATSVYWDFGNAVQGYSTDSGSLVPPPTGALSPTPLANTDIIALRSASGTGVEVTQNNNGSQVFATDRGTVAGGCSDGTNMVSGICAGDILTVTDCSKARIFQVSSINIASSQANINHSGATMTPGNALTSWGGSSAPEDEIFGPGAEIIKAFSATYFLATGTSGRPSLYQSINGVSTELLEGVEDMSISYGVDTDKNPDFTPNQYVKADAVTDWSRVLSVQIALVVASTDNNVIPEEQKYTFDGVANIAPGDRRLRQIFTSTVGIRSRLY